MPSSAPRGNETYAELFDVEPSYARDSQEVHLYMHTRNGEMRGYKLSRKEAEELYAAIGKVLAHKT